MTSSIDNIIARLFLVGIAATLASSASAQPLDGPTSSVAQEIAPLPADRLPSSLVLVAPGEEARYVLVVEKSTQRTLLYRSDRDGVELVRALPCTTGKVAGDKQFEGDLRTPEGAYWFTREIPGETLPPLYGAGAFVMDYPNRFDRLDGKTGSGIWLHGVETNDRVYVGGDTRGCVALRNDHFDEIAPLIALRDTPIVVVEEIRWVTPESLARDARVLLDFLESWRASWESKRLAPYLDHYGDRFRADGLDLDGWARRKERLADLHEEIRVALDDVTILREKDRAWAHFRQEYVATGHRDLGVKTLHLLGDDADVGSWRIVGESWRPLDEPFALIDPTSVGPPLTVEQVAAVAPDAAPEGTRAGAVTRELTDAIVPAEEGLEPGVSEDAPTAPTEEPEAPEPVAAEAAPETAPGGAPDEPTSDEGDVAEDRDTASADAPEQPASPERADEAAPPPLGWRASAALAAPERDTGRYRLLAPHARVSGGRLRVAVSLLSTRPSTWREGRVLLSVTTPDGESILLPESGASDGGRPFRFRQGETLEAAIDLPDNDGDVTVSVRVQDDSGRVALAQDIVATLEALR